jgi:soluble lytic murein transglycosylase
VGRRPHDGAGERRIVRRLLIALTGVAVLGAIALAIAHHQPDFVQRIRYPLRYEAIVRGHATNYDLDPSLLAAVIYTESRFNARARSDAGAMGLMQLLPDTARGIAVRTGGNGFVVDDLYSPEINIRYGAWYLRNLLNRYGDERTALAAYHAGPGNVDSWRKQGVGIQFPETRSYVEKVEHVKKIYADSYAKELGLR